MKRHGLYGFMKPLTSSFASMVFLRVHSYWIHPLTKNVMTTNTSATSVSDIQFIPTKPQDGLIGFVSFVLDRKWYVGSVAVYTLLNGRGIRLVYPKKNNINCIHPISRPTGDAVTSAIQEKVTELYPSFQDVYEPRRESRTTR